MKSNWMLAGIVSILLILDVIFMVYLIKLVGSEVRKVEVQNEVVVEKMV